MRGLDLDLLLHFHLYLVLYLQYLISAHPASGILAALAGAHVLAAEDGAVKAVLTKLKQLTDPHTDKSYYTGSLAPARGSQSSGVLTLTYKFALGLACVADEARREIAELGYTADPTDGVQRTGWSEHFGVDDIPEAGTQACGPRGQVYGVGKGWPAALPLDTLMKAGRHHDTPDSSAGQPF